MKKMSGLNLAQFIESKQLVLIDGFSQPYEGMQYSNLPISTSVPNTYQLQTNNNVVTFRSSPTSRSESLKNLYTILQEHTISKQDGPTLVMIENLSDLLLGVDSVSPELDLLEILSSLD